MGSASQMAKRALVSTLLAIASVFSMHLGVSRDSEEKDLRAAYAKLQRRLGSNRAAHAQQATQLKLAKVAWEQSLVDRCRAGRPATGSQCFRISAAAVLLTYQPIADMAQWLRFVTFAAGACGRVGRETLVCYFRDVRVSPASRSCHAAVQKEGRSVIPHL